MRASVLAILSGALGLVPVASGAGAAPAALCAVPHGARAILSTGAGRFWQVTAATRLGVHSRRFYACAAGHRPLLIEHGDDGADSSTTIRSATITAGLLAYGRVRKSGLGASSARLLVRRLDSGRVIYSHHALASPVGGRLEDFHAVAGSSGGLAWIASTLDERTGTPVYEVWKLDSAATRLDMGTDIAPASLAIAPDVVGWRHAGAARSAPMCSGCLFRLIRVP